MLAFHPLGLTGRLDLSRVSSDRLHLIVATQPVARVSVPAGWQSLWLPIRGRLQLESAWGCWTLASDYLVTHESPLEAAGDASPWLLLAGTRTIWHAQLALAAPHIAGVELLTRQQACPREIRHPLVRLARLLRDGDDAAACALAFNRLCLGLLTEQHELLKLAHRCNGRTPQRRVQTLQRLLRVRHLIERNDEGNLDLAHLANHASYSPWHLIRSYRDVFGETPSEHLARLRLARAWVLVRDSGLLVCEITEQLGFESQSAFCRAFKNAFGLTATQVRTSSGERTHLRPALRTRTLSARPQSNGLGDQPRKLTRSTGHASTRTGSRRLLERT